jgi:hypothetical protein
MLVGIVIGYKTPESAGSTGGTTPRAMPGAMSPTKRAKTALPNNSKILQLADCRHSSAVFALVFTGGTSLVKGTNHSAIAREIKLGDVLGVYEPLVTKRTLGDTIPLFLMWNHIVVIRQNVVFPSKPIVRSGAANQHVTFAASNLQIQFSRASLLTNDRVSCFGVTCDRQDVRCKGCNIGSALRKNIVLHVCADVMDQPRFNEQTGRATFFVRSYNLSNIFVNMSSLLHVDYDEISMLSSPLRAAVAIIQDHVNNNGGWTLYGWHRMGVKASLEDGLFEVNPDTGGHATRIEPTNASPEFLQQLQALRYSYTVGG